MKNPLSDILLPTDGHQLDHLPNDEFVKIDTEMGDGCNWWVEHDNLNLIVSLKSESNLVTKVSLEEYSRQIIHFINQVETFFRTDVKKSAPEDEYDRKDYSLFKREWREIKGRFDEN